MVKNMHYINGRYGDNDDDDAISSLETETISDSYLSPPAILFCSNSTGTKYVLT